VLAAAADGGDDTARPEKPQIKIWRQRIAYWIPAVTDTHSKYVILLALPLQQLLRERASMLRHTYTVSLV